MSRLRLTVFAILFSLTVAHAQTWPTYENDQFGYSVLVPSGLNVVSRAADGSGVIWQTGTVRLQVSGVRNRYHIKPHEWFGRVLASAGDNILEQREGFIKHEQDQSNYYWHEIYFLKGGRRVHRKTFINGYRILTVDFSYAYAHREDKYPLGVRVIESFQPVQAR